jgi:hypothetical protein
MEQTTKKKPTLLDKRFERFVAGVKDAMDKGQKSITFCGQNIQFEFEDASLEHLMEILIDHVVYSLVDSLESKAKLAVAGLLGADLVTKGQSTMQIVKQREGKRLVRQAFGSVKTLWGPKYAKRVWDLNLPATHRPRVAESTLAILEALAQHGHVPADIKEARAWGLQFPHLTNAEWTSVKKLAEVLADLPKTE